MMFYILTIGLVIVLLVAVIYLYLEVTNLKEELKLKSSSSPQQEAPPRQYTNEEIHNLEVAATTAYLSSTGQNVGNVEQLYEEYDENAAEDEVVEDEVVEDEVVNEEIPNEMEEKAVPKQNSDSIFIDEGECDCDSDDDCTCNVICSICRKPPAECSCDSKSESSHINENNRCEESSEHSSAEHNSAEHNSGERVSSINTVRSRLPASLISGETIQPNGIPVIITAYIPPSVGRTKQQEEPKVLELSDSSTKSNKSNTSSRSKRASPVIVMENRFVAEDVDNDNSDTIVEKKEEKVDSNSDKSAESSADVSVKKEKVPKKTCNFVLLKGINKGKACGKPIKGEGELCIAHMKV